MKILITGGNSDLAKYIGKKMYTLGYKIKFASSKNVPNHSHFDLNSTYSPAIFENISCVIHCSVNPKHVVTDFEKNFIKEISAKSIKLIYIGSTSSYLETRNLYGNYKKNVENLVLMNGGVSITCGLIFGDSFTGQIHKIKSILSKLPFSIQLKNTKFSYLTPVDSIPFVINQLLTNEYLKGKRINLFHPNKVEFNKLLLTLSGNKLFSIPIPMKFLLKVLSLTTFSHNYFNLDRLKGIMTSFTPELEETGIDFTELIKSKFMSSFLECATNK